MEGIVPIHLLVVGGSGFIGWHVVKEGIRRGWQVDSLGLNDPLPVRRVFGANYIVADLTLPETLSQVTKTQYDFVVNLGGYIDHTLFSGGGRFLIRTHFDGLLNLLERIDQTRLKRFVQIGSSDEYGSVPAPQSEEIREQPISPYSLGKVAATHLLQMMHRTEGFPAVILRLFLTYGPGQDQKRFLPQIIKGCLSDRTFPVSSGEQLRDFCYIDDIVRVIYRTFESEATNGQVFNVGSGLPVTIKEIIQRVCEITKKGRPQFGQIGYRVGENMALYADINKIQKVIGWKPEVNIETGIANMVKWIRNAK
jgi:nucleoside-diphosphate-sugar epimerase